MMPVVKTCFDLMGDDIVKLSKEKKFLKSKIGCQGEKETEKSKALLLKQFDDDKRANLSLSRKQKQMKKKQF